MLASTTAFTLADTDQEVTKEAITLNGGNTFIVNDEEFTINKTEVGSMVEAKMTNDKGQLVGYMTYDKDTGRLYDVLEDKEISHSVKTEISTLGLKVGDKDSQGYTYVGTYTYEYGYVASVSALCLGMVAQGATMSTAKTIAGNAVSFGTGFFYSQNQQWRKTDSQYIYVKTKVSVYERISGNNKKLGSYTRNQKKAANGTVSIDPIIA